MKTIAMVGVAALLLSSLSWAGMDEEMAHVRQEWERVKYTVSPRQQEAEFEKLSKVAESVMAKYPKRAEPAIWHGIVEASYAGAKGGFGALSLAKNARKSFEHALAIDPTALDGSAYTSLGSLYYQVPGWPIGFGDDKKARELLQARAWRSIPTASTRTISMATFCTAPATMTAPSRSCKALQAPPREGRKLADEGRRKEINELLEKIREKRR